MSAVWVVSWARAAAMMSGCEAEALGDVEAGGGSGDAEAELVGGGEGLLVEADGGVEDAGAVGGVDLERGEVGGDAGPGAEREEVGGDGDGEGGAFFGVGGGAELVEQDERGGVGVAGDAVDVDDVGGEAGEVALDGLGVADVGVDGGEEGKGGVLGGDGQAGLGHEGEQAGGLERDGFAAGVGAGDDELAGVVGEGEGEWDGGGGRRCGFAARRPRMRSSSRGWRAFGSGGSVVESPGAAKVGRVQSRSWAKRARAKWDSTSARMAVPSEDGGRRARPRARVMATRMRWISDCSSSSRRTSSLFCSMVSRGSTKTVWPEEDEPWMTPGTRRLNSALTGMTKRSPRTVMRSSCGGCLRRAGCASGAAEAGFDGAVLAFHGAADAAELGAGVVGEGAVGLDLAAQGAEERGEVVGERGAAERAAMAGQRLRERAPGGWARRLRQAATRSTTLRRARISRGSRAAPSMRALSSRGVGSKRPWKSKEPPAVRKARISAVRCCWVVDPGEVGAGFEREDPGAAEGGGGAGGDVLAEAWPLEGEGRGFGERGGELEERGHLSMVRLGGGVVGSEA